MSELRVHLNQALNPSHLLPGGTTKIILLNYISVLLSKRIDNDGTLPILQKSCPHNTIFYLLINIYLGELLYLRHLLFQQMLCFFLLCKNKLKIKAMALITVAMINASLTPSTDASLLICSNNTFNAPDSPPYCCANSRI